MDPEYRRTTARGPPRAMPDRPPCPVPGTLIRPTRPTPQYRLRTTPTQLEFP